MMSNVLILDNGLLLIVIPDLFRITFFVSENRFSKVSLHIKKLNLGRWKHVNFKLILKLIIRFSHSSINLFSCKDGLDLTLSKMTFSVRHRKIDIHFLSRILNGCSQLSKSETFNLSVIQHASYKLSPCPSSLLAFATPMPCYFKPG